MSATIIRPPSAVPWVAGKGAALRMVKDAATKAGVKVTVEKVADHAEIAGYGIASTPGLVVGGKVVHAGGLPKAEDAARWIAA